MLKKKILSVALGLMTLTSTCFAELLSMGGVSMIVPAHTQTADMVVPKFAPESIKVDKAAHTVDVLIFISPSVYNQCDEYRLERLTLFADPEKSSAKVVKVRYYKKGTDILDSEDNGGGYAFADAYDLSARYGKYHINNVLQREFAYFLDIPNEDGTPYLTPKDLGLTWINSTGKVGVFYYPKSVKVKKNNTINVKVAFWYPGENRVQTIDCTLDYNKQLFKPKSSEMRRINTGEVVESVYKGWLPGITSPRFINQKFSETDEARILSNYFKDKLVQQ